MLNDEYIKHKARMTHIVDLIILMNIWSVMNYPNNVIEGYVLWH